MTPLVTIWPFDCNEALATVLLCNDDIGHNIAITQLNISHRAGDNNICYSSAIDGIGYHLAMLQHYTLYYVIISIVTTVVML